MIKISDLITARGVISCENIDPDSAVKGGKIDSRIIEQGDIYFALKGRFSDGSKYIPDCFSKGMAFAVVEKNYVNEGNYPVVYTKNVEKTMGEMSLLWRKLHSAKVVGITGTNGKTTTKEMLACILSQKYKIISTYKNHNNQQGVPLTLFSIKTDTEIAIVEMGTSGPGEIAYLTSLSIPDAGLVTNIGEAHLERLKDKKGVYEEKINLFEFISKTGGQIFVNCEDRYLKKWNRGNITRYGKCSAVDAVYTDPVMDECNNPVFRFMGEKIRLEVFGSLNVKNAAAAAVMAGYFNMTGPEIAAGLKSYIPSDKRYQTVAYKNATVILDCYNSNPSSVTLFLQDLKQETCLILGDMLELGEKSLAAHIEVVRLAQSLKFSTIMLFGDEMKKALSHVKPHNETLQFFETFEELKAIFDKITTGRLTVAVKGSRGMQMERLLQ
jgi:UDP-N-acetylmuramoyl-tripeptide--D-alanyl-D-alanine ligase